jgi:hypothetical protein
MTSNASLAGIPLEHRVVIAQWLIARSDTFQPSILASAETVNAIKGVLTGAAADIVTPESDDTTVEHARAVLRNLTAS